MSIFSKNKEPKYNLKNLKNGKISREDAIRRIVAHIIFDGTNFYSVRHAAKKKCQEHNSRAEKDIDDLQRITPETITSLERLYFSEAYKDYGDEVDFLRDFSYSGIACILCMMDDFKVIEEVFGEPVTKKDIYALYFNQKTQDMARKEINENRVGEIETIHPKEFWAYYDMCEELHPLFEKYEFDAYRFIDDHGRVFNPETGKYFFDDPLADWIHYDIPEWARKMD